MNRFCRERKKTRHIYNEEDVSFRRHERACGLRCCLVMATVRTVGMDERRRSLVSLEVIRSTACMQVNRTGHEYHTAVNPRICVKS